MIGCDYIKYIINININNNYTRIILLKKNNKRITIEHDFIENISINNMKQLCENIKLNIHSIENTYKRDCKLLFNIQTEDIIVRNIEDINISKKRDVLGIIKYNINQYMPINLEDYKIRYKILEKNHNTGTVQIVLCPIHIIKLCNDIAQILDMKAKILNVNFDILQKLINLGTITNLDSTNLFIELRDKEFLLNKVINSIVYESYILPRNIATLQHIRLISENYNNIYYYGDSEIKEDIKELNLNLNSIILNMGKVTLDISKDLNKDVNRYINAIGIVI
ncbi:hypothetical protein [Romboutsia sp. Marseille-P6047]|uniref:hypothetical protein n=1 Tax=Romboutsia sp. Marseille-P6047 TaxID=2161817 RepID=UPI000F05B515|nr:hypothetical protein [Romboutsia sp. Marseille-P6047]